MSDYNENGNTIDPGPENDHDEQEDICKGCGSPSVVEGYSIPLCRDCREKYANRPVPTGIKLFSCVVIAIIIFSLISFPKSLNAGIAYERGQRAENAKKFATAAKEYEKVVEIFPNSFIAAGKLFIAYVKNQQFDEAEAAFARIEGKSTKDSDEGKIIEQANEAISILDAYYNVNQELVNIVQTKKTASLPDMEQKLRQYTSANPNDFFGFYYLADTLFEQEKYEEAKAAYLAAVEINPDIYFLRLGAAAAYRQTGEFDKAVAECNSVLEVNKENSDAYVSLSKIDLKRHKYKDAMEKAKIAQQYDDDNYNALYALVLAYHFSGMTAERDANLEILKKEADSGFYDLAMEIISGKSKLFD